MATAARLKQVEFGLAEKLRRLHWPFVAVIVTLGAVGYGLLYSAGGGSHEPWAMKQGVRLVLGLAIMVAVALADTRLFFRWAYVFYAVVLALLIGVEIAGEIRKGSQRWIDLGVIQLQPSEMMKIALILALSRYFHSAYLSEVKRPAFLLVPIAMILMPIGLVLKQPDLGTAIMLTATGGAMLFLAGVRLWKFALVASAVGAALPIAWSKLHDYQKQRVYTFLDPEQDPLGSGYHIIQSKIALGAGGLWGKGYLQGSQAQLSFLPEKHTDFAFTTLAEEVGFVGSTAVLVLYLALLIIMLLIALRASSHFGRLLAMGIGCNFSLYILINVAMITGLIPVVGEPLPFLSYGGTAMLTILFSFGLVLNVHVHRTTTIARFPVEL